MMDQILLGNKKKQKQDKKQDFTFYMQTIYDNENQPYWMYLPGLGM